MTSSKKFIFDFLK